jgi:superfamily I DNA and RNA helicase
MPLEVVYGESRDRGAAQALAAQLRDVVNEGTIYLAYPVFATADERVEVDALLVSRQHGLVAFLLAKDLPGPDTWSKFIDDQDKLYGVLVGYLRRHQGLRLGRQLALEPSTATIFPSRVSPPTDAEGFYGDLQEVAQFIRTLPAIDPNTERNLQAALQRVATIKPAKKRVGAETTGSKGYKLKEIERGIANLDRWQKAAAIESPEGPQRIRGLAGSGKTVVLALKAAYWHAQHPDWNIAITFHTRALYRQVADLITRFTFEHSNDQPDYEHLRIVHSWGSARRHGVYSLIAQQLGETPRDWAYARAKYGMDDAFQGVCAELLAVARVRSVTPIFDAVLIDEAQDLPPEFFQLVYMFTRDPKRIVWGYDELQKLSDDAMPDTDELFGTGSSGESLVSIRNTPNSPRRDIVLPVCYRNTPWALATAHALGIGVYRSDGLVQHPNDPNLWSDIGYNVIHGDLAFGENVTLARRDDSSPEYFEKLLSPEDAVAVHTFSNELEHDAWVAEQISVNLSQDELEYDDILIVLPDVYRAKSRAPRLMQELRARGIPSHLVGVNSNADEIFRPESIAIAHIFRAKGNEAPMVYAIDAHYAESQFNLITRRNKLFTAITRSRAWVRITGWGDRMPVIENEIRDVFSRNFRLEFNIPTQSDLRALRRRHRDRSEESEQTARKATEGLSAFLEALDTGALDIHDLPPALRTRLVAMQREEFDLDS